MISKQQQFLDLGWEQTFQDIRTYTYFMECTKCPNQCKTARTLPKVVTTGSTSSPEKITQNVKSDLRRELDTYCKRKRGTKYV